MKIKIISKIFILLIISLMFTTAISAASSLNLTKSEKIYDITIKPTNVSYQYKDENTLNYHGDEDILGIYFINSIDNTTWKITSDLVHGLIYLYGHDLNGVLEDKTFIVNATDMGEGENPRYMASRMALENGTKVKYFSISNNSLSAKEKACFDNYEVRRQEYLDTQENLAEQSMAQDSMKSAANSGKSQSKSGYYVGTRGAGFYHSF